MPVLFVLHTLHAFLIQNPLMQIIQSIQNRIYEVRSERVMLDFDLAALYEVPTKVFNQTVKRNIRRFPDDFMFRLSADEWQTNQAQILIIQPVTMRSQIVTASQSRRNTTALPYAFTEQGVAMLSGILNSDKAISMNIAIMRAFVDIRKVLLKDADFTQQIVQIKEKLDDHDVQLSQIYDALENLLDDKAAQRKWDDRERIGFRK